MTGDGFGGDYSTGHDNSNAFHDEGAHMNGGFNGSYDQAGADGSYGSSDPYSAIGAVDEEFAEPEAVQYVFSWGSGTLAGGAGACPVYDGWDILVFFIKKRPFWELVKSRVLQGV